mmetsp:Transcript_89886/g.288194  ORF Transcript_89886/g.288194 Transcript_89886/m.288194 type:complete len:91 (+) Transcript_89886:99-371(+)
MPRPNTLPKLVPPASKASVTELHVELQTVMLKLSEPELQNIRSGEELRASYRKLERVVAQLGVHGIPDWTRVPLKAIPSLMLNDWRENQS